MRKHSPRPIVSPSPRGGTTLTEVLMALLCMGIGVVAVAALFPIALLRSVQATQLTQGTVLRYNAETLVDLKPNLIFDPNVNNNFQEHFQQPYLVDPLGWSIISSDGVGTPGLVGNLPRFNFGITTEAAATSLVTLPDSWVTLYDAVSDGNNPFTNTATSITVPASAGVDFTDVTNIISSGGYLRIVLFNQNLKMSEVRYLTNVNQINGNVISWPNALPANNLYFPNKVPRIRIELQERRYTWLLTVRNYTPVTAPDDIAYAQASVDVVIFFRRAPSALEEQVFNLTLTGTRQYQVTGTGTPFLKKGGFLLDTVNGSWHRIQQVNGNVITLERNSALPLSKAIFPKGVIDVYNLGTKP